MEKGFILYKELLMSSVWFSGEKTSYFSIVMFNGNAMRFSLRTKCKQYLHKLWRFCKKGGGGFVTYQFLWAA